MFLNIHIKQTNKQTKTKTKTKQKKKKKTKQNPKTKKHVEQICMKLELRSYDVKHGDDQQLNVEQ